MSVHFPVERAAYLLSAQTSALTGAVIDARGARDYAAVRWEVGKAGSGTGASALFTIQASLDNERWTTIAQYTATATETGTAQFVGYYPWVRAAVNTSWTASGAAGTGTAQVYLFYAPGIGY